MEVKHWSDYGEFQLPEVRESKGKHCQISILSFQCVAENVSNDD